MNENELENEQNFFRTQFQIDRIAFFSDAVIAIAITLLVLEIKIPVIPKHVSFAEFFNESGDLIIQQLAALYICFVAIGGLWLHHHELFEFVTGYNKRLIKTNLYFLFTVIVLPLSISFNMNGDNQAEVRILVLIVNLLLAHVTFYRMLLIISHRKNVFHNLKAIAKISSIKQEILYISVTLLLVCIVAMVSLKFFYLPFFILPIRRAIIQYKKYRTTGSRKEATVK